MVGSQQTILKLKYIINVEIFIDISYELEFDFIFCIAKFPTVDFDIWSVVSNMSLFELLIFALLLLLPGNGHNHLADYALHIHRQDLCRSIELWATHSISTCVCWETDGFTIKMHPNFWCKQ